MKKIYMLPLIASLCVFLSVQAFAGVQEILRAEKSNSQIYINGEKKDLKNAPVTINGTTYVPLREMGENMNTDVIWKNSEKKINLYSVPLQKRIDTFFPILKIPTNDKIIVKNIDYEYSYSSSVPSTHVIAILEMDKNDIEFCDDFGSGQSTCDLKTYLDNDIQDICANYNLNINQITLKYGFNTYIKEWEGNGIKSGEGRPFSFFTIVGGKKLEDNKVSVILTCSIPDIIECK